MSVWHGWREAVRLSLMRWADRPASLEPHPKIGNAWHEPRLDETEMRESRVRRAALLAGAPRLRLVERGEPADGAAPPVTPRAVARRGSGETHPRSTL